MEDFTINKRKKMHGELISYIFLDFCGNRVNNDRLNLIPTLRGNFMISENDIQRVGKIEQHEDRNTFFIKTIKFGSPGEVLANPVDGTVRAAYGDTDSRSKTYEYTKVNEETFNMYERFLFTKNAAYFNNIQRRLNDGEA